MVSKINTKKDAIVLILAFISLFHHIADHRLLSLSTLGAFEAPSSLECPEEEEFSLFELGA
jgi:hypothetical protein